MAKPKLALIPAAQGDKFYSVLPSDGVGDFDFTRASTGTRIAPTGLIEEVASGDSRLNYDLLNGKVVNCPHYLLEPARTNLITYSEDFSNSYWIKGDSTVSINQAISPDGSLNADKLTPNNITAIAFIYYQVTLSASNYTFSFFVKYNGRQYLQLLFGSSASTDFSNFDLINGIVTSGTGEIKNYGNDWYKISLTANVNSGATQIYLLSIDNASSLRAASSTGNGIDGYYIFGAQIEEGTYPTSYIPTNGTAITRAAETATGSGDAATFNDSEGVLMAEISALDSSTQQFSISNGTSSSAVKFLYLSNNVFRFEVRDNLVTQVSINITLFDVTENIKAAGKYKENDFALWVNGFKLGIDTSGTIPTGLSELAYDQGNSTTNVYGKTREVQYFDSVLTDAQLETLTSWTSLQEMITSQLYTNY